MNPNARIETVEVKLNPAEVGMLDQICAGLGRSPFLRHLIHREAQSHGKPPPRFKEARQCRATPMANRASAGMRRQV